MSVDLTRILVVEDNDICRDDFTNILRTAGYEAIPLRNGLEALEYLEIHPAPDLILLDMLMPVLDGWHFLKRLQIRIPIIITTGTVLTREWAASHDCAGCLRKPVRGEDLLAEIRDCLG